MFQSRIRFMKQYPKNKRNWAGRRCFGIYFCAIFDRECQGFTSQREEWVLFCFQPFLRFFLSLSLSATGEATRMQFFLYWISCTALLGVNRTYTKILKCFIILCSQLLILVVLVPILVVFTKTICSQKAPLYTFFKTYSILYITDGLTLYSYFCFLTLRKIVLLQQSANPVICMITALSHASLKFLL